MKVGDKDSSQAQRVDAAPDELLLYALARIDKVVLLVEVYDL